MIDANKFAQIQETASDLGFSLKYLPGSRKPFQLSKGETVVKKKTFSQVEQYLRTQNRSLVAA